MFNYFENFPVRRAKIVYWSIYILTEICGIVGSMVNNHGLANFLSFLDPFPNPWLSRVKQYSFPNPLVFCLGPGPPSRVRFTNVGRTSVTIAWDPPVYPRGVITRYRVAYRFNSTSSGFIWQSLLGRNERQRTAGALNAQSFYRFFVWAGTNTSWSDLPAEAVVYTGGSTGK